MNPLFFLFFCLVFLVGCNRLFTTARVQYTNYRMYNLRVDSSVYKWLQPYRDSVEGAMHSYVVTLANDLEKQQPEGTLGNMMADALFEMAAIKFGKHPDAAFMNNGGIRLPVLKAGTITVGTIYELFPFDNVLVLVTVPGTVLQQFLDHIAARGGWPVAGITMQIYKGKAVEVQIGGKPINAQQSYTIAVGDYTANGGDDAAMLIGMPQQSRGYLIRDAIIDFLKEQAKKGRPLTYMPEKRVQYVQ